MLVAALIIALIVLSIHYTMLDGEIFGKLGNWFAKNLPAKIHPSVFECNVCMTPWYGTPLYFLLFQKGTPLYLMIFGKGDAPWWYIFPTLLVAMGINVVINKWAPKEEIEISGKEPIEVIGQFRKDTPEASVEPMSVIWDVKIKKDSDRGLVGFPPKARIKEMTAPIPE